jgi:hypothetical protein
MSLSRPPKTPTVPSREGAHPTADAWFARATGRLSPRAAAGLDRHRLWCPACARLAAVAARAARAVDFSDLPAVPVALRRAAERMVGGAADRDARLTVPAAAFGRMRLITAMPAFASASGMAGVGVRRTAEALRRCALEGGSWRLELEWTPQDRAWQLRGRVVDTDDSGAVSPTFTLESTDPRARRVQPGPRGFFGPLRIPSPEVRVTLVGGEKSFRSPWLPRAPRRR